MTPEDTPFARYLDHINEHDCWITWLAPNGSGYGTVWVYQPVRRKVGLHVAAYEYCSGPVPYGLVLDHFVCQNPPCFNPTHVEPVTVAENVRRAMAAIRSSPYPCGHPRTTENTDSNGRRGGLRCKTCNRDRRRSLQIEGAA